jgi:hypothetical protein
MSYIFLYFKFLKSSSALPKKPAAFYPKARLLFEKGGGLLKFAGGLF